MRTRVTNICFFFLMIFCLINLHCKSAGDSPTEPTPPQTMVPIDSLSNLLDLLDKLAVNSDNIMFQKHCASIKQVIETRTKFASDEFTFLKDMYTAFSDSNEWWSPKDLSSYLVRKRPFIISWTSPTDGAVSLAWLFPPQNWVPEQEYPLYVSLHGLYGPFSNAIQYMTTYLKPGETTDKSFENGYYVFPWGRGNLWYEGISETDIWECITEIELNVNIDQSKKFIMGHSMGGYGAWVISQKSPEFWAGVGVYAGALWHNTDCLSTENVLKLKDVPVYIVCGDSDGLIGSNTTAYDMLVEAGNQNVKFVTFTGGHESLYENWENMYNWLKNFSN